MAFTLYEPDTAPSESAAELEISAKVFGFIPNLHKVLAASPIALKTYKHLHTQFQNTSFSATELTVVWQTINHFHGCHYCLPAHTGIAYSMDVDADIINELYEGKALADTKLRVLQTTTLALTEQRGVLTEEQLQAFKAVGYGEQQLLEIVIGLAQKVVSNYTNHLANTPVDDQFAKFVK